MKNPKVSVIMPVYNSENYIKQAIDSILNQTYSDFELIIIDDCPQDKSMDVVNTFIDDRIHIIHNKLNSGIAYSRNKGLEYSSGKYIAIMDHDDISMKNRFVKQLEYLEKNSEIDVIGGKIQLIDKDGTVIVKPSIKLLNNPKYIKAMFLFVNIYCNSEVMFRKNIIIDNNIRYQNDCFGMEDFHFWIDCSKVGNMSNIDELFLQHRVTDDNETSRTNRTMLDQRNAKFAQLQKYSLYKSGFRIPEDYLAILNKTITEHDKKCETINEIRVLYKAFQEIVHQSRSMKMDNCEEIQILCKKLLISKINAMDNMWE